MINWDKYNEAMSLEASQSDLRACWADKDGSDDHGRAQIAHEKAATHHEKAQEMHQAAEASSDRHGEGSHADAHAQSVKAEAHSGKANIASEKIGEKTVVNGAPKAKAFANKATSASTSGDDHHEAARYHEASAQQHRDAANYHKYQAQYRRGSH